MSLVRQIVSVLSSQWCHSHNWKYLIDADIFLQFPILIRILELISVPKHSRDSFILIIFNTLFLWREIVSVLSSQWCNSHNWIYLNDADVFLEFPILIRILELISVPKHSRDSFILIIFNTMSLVRQIVSVLSRQCVIHIIGYILMMQMFFFNFDFDSDSRAHFRSETLQRFIYFNNIQHFVLMEGNCQ